MNKCVFIVFKFFHEYHDANQLVKISLVCKYWRHKIQHVLSSRIITQNFSRQLLPKIIMRRSLSYRLGSFIIDMHDLINNQITTPYEAFILFRIQSEKHGPSITLATIINLITCDSAKNIWMDFFKKCNINVYVASLALFNIPKKTTSFLFIDS